LGQIRAGFHIPKEKQRQLQELIRNGYVHHTTHDNEGRKIIDLLEKGRDEVEAGFPTFSDSPSITIDKESFKLKIDELKHINDEELAILRNLEKSYKSTVRRFEDFKEMLTDVSFDIKESEYKAIIDRILSIDPTNLARFAKGVVEFVNHPKYEELVEKYIGEKPVPLIPMKM